MTFREGSRKNMPLEGEGSLLTSVLMTPSDAGAAWVRVAHCLLATGRKLGTALSIQTGIIQSS